MRGLYPIVDVDSLRQLGSTPLAIVQFAERVLEARPPLLQLRAKHSGAGETLGLLRALRPLCERAGTRLIANDRADLAALARCDGVHIGQDDLPPSVVRLIAPGLLVGISTHDLSQLETALADKPDYVAFGPVFGTASKERPDKTVGVAKLAEAHARARAAGIPLVAIGGINLARMTEVAPHCELAAVIAALHPVRSTLLGVSEATCALHAALTT
ncbi:MAG: thiamine phosphate synthase [Polyangiaceae bacterium]